MKHEKSLFWLAIVILLVGDVLYFGSLLFKSHMITLIMKLSPELTESQLSSTGESAVLFVSAVLGAVMYLVGFLLIALSRKERTNQIKFIYFGLGVWFGFDSLASIIFGFEYNVVVNLILLIISIIFIKSIND